MRGVESDCLNKTLAVVQTEGAVYSQQIIALPSPTLCRHSMCVLLPVRPALGERELRVVSLAPFDEVVVVFRPCSGVWTTAGLPQLEGSVGGQAGHLSRGGGREGYQCEWDLRYNDG